MQPRCDTPAARRRPRLAAALLVCIAAAAAAAACAQSGTGDREGEQDQRNGFYTGLSGGLSETMGH